MAYSVQIIFFSKQITHNDSKTINIRGKKENNKYFGKVVGTKCVLLLKGIEVSVYVFEDLCIIDYFSWKRFVSLIYSCVDMVKCSTSVLFSLLSLYKMVLIPNPLV